MVMSIGPTVFHPRALAAWANAPQRFLHIFKRRRLFRECHAPAWPVQLNDAEWDARFAANLRDEHRRAMLAQRRTKRRDERAAAMALPGALRRQAS